MSDFNQPPERPPILPPSINEEVFAPKRQMNFIRDVARKRLKKHHKKFEKLIRKFFKKAGEKDRYVQFYDIGYRFEAVFYEITSDGMHFLGETVEPNQARDLIQWISSQMKIPFMEVPDETPTNSSIILVVEQNEQAHVQVLQMIAYEEFEEIKRLAKKVEEAPRQNNPGA